VPSVLSNGQGSFRATINGDNTITYRLTYSGFTSSVIQAHLHFAQPGVNGGVFAFLCGPAGVPGGPPACPASGGTVTGTLTAAAILGTPAQGVTPGSLADAVRVLRSGEAYTNVHTVNHPGGEIRGQINSHDDD